jgi:hypothetical protein
MIEETADKWLARCAEIFDGEGGYVPNPSGGYMFDPAPLREEVPTVTLASLLTIADSINAEEEYRHILSTGDMYQSLIVHMNRRAEAGDTQAAEVLEQRMWRILDEG